MITDEIRKELDQLPDQVLVNYIGDSVAENPSMTRSTFLLAMKFRTVEALEFYDYAVERLRTKIAARVIEKP